MELEKIIAAWNNKADDFNQWESLDCDEKISFVINYFVSNKPTILDPDMPEQELRLHMGELTASEVRVARAAIAWANTRHNDNEPEIDLR